MNDFNQREYQTVILAALLHDARCRLIGDKNTKFKIQNLIFKMAILIFCFES